MTDAITLPEPWRELDRLRRVEAAAQAWTTARDCIAAGDISIDAYDRVRRLADELAQIVKGDA